MDVREKLVELIAQKVCKTWSGTCDQWLPHDCGKCYANDCHISEIADHLISNGVTVQEQDGCEYCNEDSEGYRKMIGAFSITNPFHGNVWNLETRNCKPRQIYFCPMCGRRLTQPQKGE